MWSTEHAKNSTYFPLCRMVCKIYTIKSLSQNYVARTTQCKVITARQELKEIISQVKQCQVTLRLELIFTILEIALTKFTSAVLICVNEQYRLSYFITYLHIIQAHYVRSQSSAHCGPSSRDDGFHAWAYRQQWLHV